MMRNSLASIFFFLTGFTLAAGEEPVRWTAGNLEGTGSPPLPFIAVEAFPGLKPDRAVDLDLYPGEIQGWVVTELGGNVWWFDEESPADRTLVADFNPPGEPPRKGNQGLRLYSIQFDPGFPDNPWVYLSSNRRADGSGLNRIFRCRVQTGHSLQFDVENAELLLEWESAGHDGCDLKFGPDGLLYISTGDGEAPGDPANVGQKTDNHLGSILRIDVRDPQPGKIYQIPPDNPFVEEKDVPPEVYAYGLRNPWRMNFHPETGVLFLGDNGDEHWELVRRVGKGTNHGWSAFEGTHPFRLSNPLSGPTVELTTPVYEHPHIEMRSVIGGVFYRGKELAGLADHYVYACYFTRKVWAFSWDGVKAGEPRRIADVGHQPVSFAEDANGEVLVVTHDGPVYRLKKNENPPAAKPIPPTLSATGLFEDTESLKPATGVHRYSINAAMWSDGGETIRHFAMTPEKFAEVRVGETQHKSWRFPNGSAFARTIGHPLPDSTGDLRFVETQILHKDAGEWQFLTYAWRPDGKDADLVPEAGLTQPCRVGDQTRSHRFASRAECSACHTQKSFFALAMSTEQLNRHVGYADKSINQLDQFAQLGVFPDHQKPRSEMFPPLTNPADESAGLEDRARSYLHINCAHCHRETGLGGRAQFQLLHWLTLEETGAVNARPMIGLPGVEDVRVIAPGAPDRSEIVRRMEIRGPNQMPLISSHRIDPQGLALIREWISSLSALKHSKDQKPERP